MTTHTACDCHAETCRGRNCTTLLVRSKMVKASTIPTLELYSGRVGAFRFTARRGYFCESCARREAGWQHRRQP